jgi:hypothetical protein
LPLRRFSLVFLAVLAVFSAAALDRWSRVRAAGRKAERLERLALRPVDRDRALEAAFLDGVAALDRRRPSAAEREAGVEALRKRWEMDRLRSPWTDAYHAWRDVHALYAPPEGPWTRRARLSAPAARQRWREEWTVRRLPFDEGLLDRVAGEEEGFRLLCSFPGEEDLKPAAHLLAGLGVPYKSVFPADAAPAGRDALLLVPEDRFWEAHKALRPLAGLDENW